MTLQEIGLKYGTDKAYAHHYCDFYEQFLPNPSQFTGRILEIGIKDGASLRMWRDYYPSAKEIVGIDIEKPKPIFGCNVHQMDQCDVNALHQLGEFDIIIDDGSHMTLHQQISFNKLFYTQLSRIGCYVMEDLHTSFYPAYINSKFTTYAVMKELMAEKIEWCRVEDKSDSLTAILWK